MTKIIFAAPNYGPLFAPVVSSWLGCVAYTSRYVTVENLGLVGGVSVTDRQYTHTAENNCVQEFLGMKDATHLFLTESDMILPKDAIVNLLKLDKDAASGIYFLRGGQGTPCLFMPAKATHANNPYGHTQVTAFPEDKPFKIGCPGLGCVLIKRKVFETLKPPWFDLKESDDKGRGWGSDMYFYYHLRQAGFECWVAPSVKCDQIEYTVWSYRDYKKRLETDPTFMSKGFLIGWSREQPSDGGPTQPSL